MRVTQFARFLLVGLCFWFASREASAQAANLETVTLPTGKIYQVEMSGGKPRHQWAKRFQALSLAPEVIRYSYPNRCDLRWKMVVTHPERPIRNLEMRCLNDGGPWISVGQVPEREQAPDKGRLHLVWTIGAFDRGVNPAIWKNLKEGAVLWAGFEFRLTFEDAEEAPLELTQFVKLYAWEVDSILYRLEGCSGNLENSRKVHTLPLPDGSTGTAVTVNGRVERTLNEAVCVIGLTPALLPDPASPGSAKLVWLLDGRLYWEGVVDLSIASPTVPGMLEQGRLSAEGSFRILFAHADRCPGMWAWLAQPGETWLPLEIQAKRVADGRSLTWMEWVLIPESVKSRLRDLLHGPVSKKE